MSIHLRIVRKYRSMPTLLGMIATVFLFAGILHVFALAFSQEIILADGSLVSRDSLFESNLFLSVLATAIALIVISVTIFRRMPIARLALFLFIFYVLLTDSIETDRLHPAELAGNLLWLAILLFYLFRKRSVIAYFARKALP